MSHPVSAATRSFSMETTYTKKFVEKQCAEGTGSLQPLTRACLASFGIGVWQSSSLRVQLDVDVIKALFEALEASIERGSGFSAKRR